MSLSELIERFGTEAQRESALERARWPSGFVYPECGESAHSRFLAEGRQYWQCAHCRAQATVRSGTLFHASKLPLSKGFQAIFLVTQNKNNLSALALNRYLGVCYRTAWRVKHKLLEAMAERESRPLFTGVVVADDVYLGGVHAGKPGRGSENKVPFMAAVELNDEGHPLHVRFDPTADLKGSTLASWARTAPHKGVHLLTDGLASFAVAGLRRPEFATVGTACAQPSRPSRA
jgi:transposase-like protein